MNLRKRSILSPEQALRYLSEADDPAAADGSAVAVDIRELAHEGYEVWAAARRTMELLTPIEIQFDFSGELETVWFDPIEISSRVTIERVRQYETRAGTRLLPLGGLSWDHLMLFLGENGSVYGGMDDLLLLYGSSIQVTIENIINDAEVEEL